MSPSPTEQSRRRIELDAGRLDASALWDLVPDALLAVERTGMIAAANTAAGDVFGAEIGELVGRSVETLMPEAIRARHIGLRRDWTDHPRPRLMASAGVLPALTLDGRAIDVQIALHPVTIDDELLTIAVVRELTSDDHSTLARAEARDELAQRLFGLGMSLRALIPRVRESEAVGRIEEVVHGMSEVVDALDAVTLPRPAPGPGDDR